MEEKIEFGFVGTKDILEVLLHLNYERATMYKARKVFKDFKEQLERNDVRQIDPYSIGADDFVQLFSEDYGVPREKLERVVLKVFENKKSNLTHSPK